MSVIPISDLGACVGVLVSILQHTRRIQSRDAFSFEVLGIGGT
jgi:hypothetical protein